MNINFKSGLLFTSISICYNGQIAVVDNIVIDTGAARTIISPDAVYDIGIYFQNGDIIDTMFGIGGEEYAFRKNVDTLSLGEFKIEKCYIDFGAIDSKGEIKGLLGLDFLITSKAIINLRDFSIMTE